VVAARGESGQWTACFFVVTTVSKFRYAVAGSPSVHWQVKQGWCISGVGTGSMVMWVKKGNDGMCCDWITVYLGQGRGYGIADKNHTSLEVKVNLCLMLFVSFLLNENYK